MEKMASFAPSFLYGGLSMLLFAIGYPLFSMLTDAQPPPMLGKVEPFVLIKEDGEPMHFGKDDRPVVVNFIYTRCPDICPLLTAKMAELQKRIPLMMLYFYRSLSIQTTTPLLYF